MKNTTIKLKILILVFVGLVGIAFSATMSILNANQGKNSLSEFITKAVASSDKMKKLDESISWTFTNTIEVTSDFSPPVGSYPKMKEEIVLIDKQLKNLDNEIFVKNADIIQRINKNWILMKKILVDKILPAYDEEDLELVGEISQIEVSVNFFAIKKDIIKLEKLVHDYYEQIKTDSNEKLDNSKELSIVVSFLCIVLFLFIGFYITKYQFVKPILLFQEGLLEFFNYLNKTTTKIVLLDENRKDELGQMAKIINENISNIEKNIKIDLELIADTTKVSNEVKYGKLSSRVEKDSNNPELNKLKNEVNEMIASFDENISMILAVLNSYSNLDYTRTIDKGSIEDKLAELFDGVNGLGQVISQMLLKSLQNGEKLKSSSIELLKNVDTLNESSNEAASSIEETAAALEEITSTVISNSDKIVEMSNNANELSSSVVEGEKLAVKTTSAMDDINNQVIAINDAIVVIDQIAFQTNILSLNAAVEAATAGEAGKGFSVVAQEVRNLASRSAEAAKEIKDLVQNASVKAAEGKSISDIMIQGYGSLHENIDKTIVLINDVSASSKEQQFGIEQINTSVNSLDEQTQKNAASAMQSSEIAHGTSDIADEIVLDANSKEFMGKK